MSKLGLKRGNNLADEAKRMSMHAFHNMRLTETPEERADKHARQHLSGLCQDKKNKQIKYGWGSWAHGRRVSCIAAALLLACTPCRAAQVDPERAVNAIIGEAEGESYFGKLCIAAAIRNRGHLRGVYGERAPRVVGWSLRESEAAIKLYGRDVRRDAVRAWEESEHNDPTHGATGWGNDADLREFAKHKWWRKCVVTCKIGGHTFYKERTTNKEKNNKGGDVW